MNNNKARDIAIKANINVHSALANSGEYQKSPHFKPENITKVQEIVLNLVSLCDPHLAVDFGCGTGFMINILHQHFEKVHGIDITPDMMKFVDLSPGNIELHTSLAEETPFPDNTFDFASAYSFMDHLVDYKVFLKEVYRVLKPGGVFYSDLNPNKDFILAMKAAESYSLGIHSELVKKEINGALHNGDYYNQNFGIDAEDLNNAEPLKSSGLGFSAQEVYEFARHIGFTKCIIEYEWFLGQGKVMHEVSFELSQAIDSHLKGLTPVSSSLYKYLRFIFTK